MSSSKNQSNETLLLNGALKPSLVIGVLAISISSAVQGFAGLYGALLAQLIVLIYFIVHIFVSKISTNLDPISTMALALFSYFAKLFFLGLFLWALAKFTPRDTIDRASFGISAVALTAAWLGGEIRSYLKLKTHLPLPPAANR